MRRRFGLPYPTWEGVYLSVIFIALCIASMMRQINLLLLIAGLMLGPIIVSWFLCRIKKEWFQVERRLPETIHAQSEFRLKLKLTNVSRGTLLGIKARQKVEGIRDWGLGTREGIEGAMEQGLGIRGNITSPQSPVPSPQSLNFSSFFPRLVPASPAESEMVCRIDEPGKYVLEPIELVYRFPLGLFECRVRVGRKASFWVYPALLDSIPDDLIQMTAQTWDGVSRGTSTSSRNVGDFHSVDSYRPGEDARLIHWRSSARKGELVVRRFDPPQGRWLAMVVSCELRVASCEKIDGEPGGVSPRNKCEKREAKKEGTRDQGLGTRGNTISPQSPVPSPQSLNTPQSPVPSPQSLSLSLAATLIDRLCRQSDCQTNIVLAHTGINGEIISGHADSTFFHRAMQMLAVAQPEEENDSNRMDEIVEQIKRLIPEGTQIIKIVGARAFRPLL